MQDLVWIVMGMWAAVKVMETINNAWQHLTFREEDKLRAKIIELRRENEKLRGIETNKINDMYLDGVLSL